MSAACLSLRLYPTDQTNAPPDSKTAHLAWTEVRDIEQKTNDDDRIIRLKYALSAADYGFAALSAA